VAVFLLQPLLLLISLGTWSGQPGQAPALPSTPRLITNAALRPSPAAVRFVSFEFQDSWLLHAGPGLFPVQGALFVDREYVVELRIEEELAIQSAALVAVDTAGAPLQTIAVARHGAAGTNGARHVGLMTMPAQPFRVALVGTTIDGRPFQRVNRRLFEPRRGSPAQPPKPTDLTPEQWGFLLAMIDEARPLLFSEVAAKVAGNPGGRIVTPQMAVTNVTYAPLMSTAGRPIGIRITYDVTFSANGEFDPAVGVQAHYPADTADWRYRLVVLNSAVTPAVRYAHAPHAEFTPTEMMLTPLEYGAHYLYEAGKVYQFAAELVPAFVVHNLEKTKSCLYIHQFRDTEKAFATFMRLVSDDAPMDYTVAIGPNAFKGRIRGLYGDGTFYRSFLEEGAPDCGAQPTRRF
jgi:hypothetical protein